MQVVTLRVVYSPDHEAMHDDEQMNGAALGRVASRGAAL